MKSCKRCLTNVDSAFGSEKDIICKYCQENLKKKLDGCGDWETNKKQNIKKLLAEEGDDLEYAKELHEGGNTYKICQECKENFVEEINNFGDVREVEHECKPQSSSETLSKSNTTERERERESNPVLTKLKTEIHQLEQINNKTSEQNQKLKELKDQLAKLENNQQEENPKKNYLPWILGGVGLVSLMGIITYFILKNKKEEKNNG